MSRSVLSLALLVLAVLLSPHARASNTHPDSDSDEVPPTSPWGSPTLPKNTIGPSAPVGYLGGSGAVTPAGSYAWELGMWVPPGRSIEPDVRFSYSSRGGNDLLGVGFSLGGDLAEIHRCGQTIAVDGQVTGVDFSSADRFCLSGQRLVLIQGGVSTQFAYDAFQQRVHKTNGADATISLADLYERRARDGIVELRLITLHPETKHPRGGGSSWGGRRLSAGGDCLFTQRGPPEQATWPGLVRHSPLPDLVPLLTWPGACLHLIRQWLLLDQAPPLA